jgi:hypothetical protein
MKASLEKAKNQEVVGQETPFETLKTELQAFNPELYNKL